MGVVRVNLSVRTLLYIIDDLGPDTQSLQIRGEGSPWDVADFDVNPVLGRCVEG